MSLESHRQESPTRVRFAVITVSDTRDERSDRGGESIVARVQDAGHRVTSRAWVRDDAREIESAVRMAASSPEVDMVLATGGTGIAPRDVTYPTLAGMFESDIPGFGELFRWLSFQEIGSAAILSRACAGLVGGKVVIALPGSPSALELALDAIVLREAGHLVSQARGGAARP